MHEQGNYELGIINIRMEELKKQLRLLLAGAACKNISKEDIHELIDEIYDEYGGLG